MDYVTKARTIVYDYTVRNHGHHNLTEKNFTLDDVLLVWYSKTLKNWKALVITTLPDQRYFEVTYNGDKKETYLDIYDKTDNICIDDKTFEETHG